MMQQDADTKNLLLEIGMEEAPAGVLPTAFEDLRKLLTEALTQNMLTFGKMEITGTPRRIVAHVENLVTQQPIVVIEEMGPPVKAAFDEHGAPKPAAVGFAKKMGVTVEKLKRKNTDRGEYLCAEKKTGGRKTISILEEILPKVVLSIPWRKSMRWGDGETAFVRPIRWLLALFGTDTVKFKIEGIKSDKYTYGHRFMSPNAIEIKDYETYKAKLKESYVLVEHTKRLELIKEEVKKEAHRLGGKPAAFEELYDEVNFLVEYPVIVSASFPKHYLDVPAPALKAAMVGHQRYFPIEDTEGNLLNHFITVANTKAKDMHVVAQGNARVLNARLADAKFFFEHDKKKSLEARLSDLKGIIFLKEVGSYYEKALRLQKLAEQIAEWIAPTDTALKKHASRAALLAKTDLTTGMVGEFPSLQGIMGGIYARTSGEAEEVAAAIEEHYLPRSAKDIEENVVPQSLAGACVAIADRIDTLTACLGVGLKPKGDKDPYGLRRASYGILAVIREKQLRIKLKELINAAIEQLKGKITADTQQLQNELWEYFIDRIWNQIIENGMTGDVANAVTRSNAQDYLDFFARAQALNKFKNEIEGFDDLATSFRRVGNILENLHKDEVDESLFDHDSERELYRAFKEIKNKITELAKESKYYEALYVLAELRPVVDKFFDDVLVNDPKDEKRRINRHSLLYQIHRLFLNVADFSAISKVSSDAVKS